jgi:hypothetical protein
LQDFVSFKTFLGKKDQKRLKEGSKHANVNEGKFVLNIDALFAFIIAFAFKK